MRSLWLYVLSILFLGAVSCNKEHYYQADDATLKFSSDTISFDTVFSTQGTATQRLKIYNPYDKILKVSNIRLAGTNSPFILNINGTQINSKDDVEIYPKDSLYIFIQVFVNPTGVNSPLFIRDSIIFTVNNNEQNVKLIAYGQDIHLIRDEVIKTGTWEADKPYLLFGNIIVDTLQTLTIAQGASIHFHKNSSLFIKGTLIARGDLNAPVTFRGDRLEKDYKDIPGQWGGIYLLPGSGNHQLDWCIIENGTSGLKVGDYDSDFEPDLKISNSIIRNMSYNSLLAIKAKIKAVNCVIADAATYTCGLIGGGDYEFYHCTIANYFGGYSGREFCCPTLKIANFYYDSQYAINVANPLVKADFYNTVIYGNNTEEISIDSVKSVEMHYKFWYCLIRSKKYDNKENSVFIRNIWNEDPKFKEKPISSFELDTLSPAKDKGDTEIGLAYPLDLKKNDRTIDDRPDIGAYERVETK